MFNYLKNFSGVLERAGLLYSLLVSLWECNFCTPSPSLAFALLWGWHWSFCECHLRMILNSIFWLIMCSFCVYWLLADVLQWNLSSNTCSSSKVIVYIVALRDGFFFNQKIIYLNSKVFVTTFPSIFIWCEQLFTGVILLQVFNYFLFFKSLILKIILWVC